MPFFGPGGLGGVGAQTDQLDPKLVDALMQQFPGLASLGPQAQQAPNPLQAYQYPGPQFFPGQGAPNSFGNLSPFEGAKGMGSESITAGLALGNYGKSQSQTPMGSTAQPFSLGQLNLPSLQLPQQVAAAQGGGDELTGGAIGAGAPQGGVTIGANDVLGGVNQAIDMLPGSNLGNQTTTPGFAEQRAGERTDYSNLTGSPSGIPQTIPQFSLSPAQTGAPAGFGADTSFSVGNQTPPLAPGGFQPTSFTLPESGDVSMSAPGGSAQFALGQPGQTDLLGAAQGGLGALGGLYNLYGGATQGDIGGSAMGGLQTIGGLTSLLQSSPGLAASLGLDAGGAALGGVGGAAGGIGGLYSLYQGIQSGNPVQMATGLLSAYQGGASLMGAITGETAPGILTGFATIAPETSAAVASAMGAAVPAGATATEIASAITTAASAWALPVAAVVQAVMDTVAQQERERTLNAGFYNNPIKGALYSASTAGVSGVNDLLKNLGSDLSGKDTYELGQALSAGVNNLMPYYATAQGGRGAIKASDTITGAGADWSAKPYMEGQTPEQYTALYQQAQQGVEQLVNELLKRGVTYEQLGQLPVNGDWGGGALSAGGLPENFYQMNQGKYDAEAAQLMAKAREYRPMISGSPNPENAALAGDPANWAAPTQGLGIPDWMQIPGLDPMNRQDLLAAAEGSARSAPDSATHAGGLITSMYGGPLWTALARMNAGGPELQSQISQHFDPWATIRNFTPQQLFTSLQPYTMSPIMAQQPGGSGYSQPGEIGPAPSAPVAPAGPDFWGQLGQQYAQKNDPMTQQLAQYIQQLQQVQGGLPQIQQGLQQQETAGLDPAVVAALQQSGGFGPAPSAGGGAIDLQALLKQLGLAA